MRVEQTEISGDGASDGEKYLIYKFICKTQLDYQEPKNLILINTQTKTEHYLPIRHINTKNRANMERQSLLTICLDMNSYNRSFSDDFIDDTNIAQYFLHHELIGISSFIVYNSNINQIHQHIVDLLTNKYGIRLSILPYNFPYVLGNREKNRAIIEADCAMRTSRLSKYVMVTSLDEYLYPASKISSQSPLVKLLSRSSNEVNRFELTTKSVCTDSRIKILSDNEKYSTDIKNTAAFIDKNEYSFNKEVNDIGKKSKLIDPDLIVLHKYLKCPSKHDLYKWRTTLREDHVEYINFISRELNKLLFNN